eukprot:9466525-Pyramimonas_sp.AAC.1
MDGDWTEDIFGGVSFQFHDNCVCCPDRDLFRTSKRRRTQKSRREGSGVGATPEVPDEDEQLVKAVTSAGLQTTYPVSASEGSAENGKMLTSTQEARKGAPSLLPENPNSSERDNPRT